MSRPVDEILADVRERGLHRGTERELCERFADLSPSDILAVIFETGSDGLRLAESEDEAEPLIAIENLAMVLAHRLEPESWRRACALIDPEFTFSSPQPMVST